MKTFRKRIYFFCLLIGLSIFLGLLAFTKKQVISNRPNIIIIMADDMGCSDIGCYGS